MVRYVCASFGSDGMYSLQPGLHTIRVSRLANSTDWLSQLPAQIANMDGFVLYWAGRFAVRRHEMLTMQILVCKG